MLWRWTTSIPKNLIKPTIFYNLCFCYIYKQFLFIKLGAGGVLVGDREVLLTRLWSGNQTHDSIRGCYGSMMNFPSSLGVLLCELRPDIDTLLCSIGLECVQKKPTCKTTSQKLRFLRIILRACRVFVWWLSSKKFNMWPFWRSAILGVESCCSSSPPVTNSSAKKKKKKKKIPLQKTFFIFKKHMYFFIKKNFK